MKFNVADVKLVKQIHAYEINKYTAGYKGQKNYLANVELARHSTVFTLAESFSYVDKRRCMLTEHRSQNIAIVFIVPRNMTSSIQSYNLDDAPQTLYYILRNNCLEKCSKHNLELFSFGYVSKDKEYLVRKYTCVHTMYDIA